MGSGPAGDSYGSVSKNIMIEEMVRKKERGTPVLTKGAVIDLVSNHSHGACSIPRSL